MCIISGGMCGQLICVLSQVDVWLTNVYYLRWMCGQLICVLTQVDVWSTNVYYLRWMCGQQMCIISGGCVVNKYV